MIQKSHIENYLRLNDVPTTAPDDDIRTVLRAGNWHHDDVEVAILVLRDQQPVTPTDTEGSLHTLINSDRHISPETLSSLLGLDIVLKREQLKKEYHHDVRPAKESHVALWLAIFGLSIILAFFSGMFFMSLFNIGPYYSPVVEDLRF